MNIKFILLVFVCASFYIKGYSQAFGKSLPPADSGDLSTPELIIGSRFNNKVNFWGRNFGIDQYGIDPYAVVNFGNGFYVYGATLFWSKMPEKPVETDIGLGFESQISRAFYIYAGYERWLSHSSDYYSKKSLENYLEGIINYDLKWFQLEGAAYFMFGIDRLLVIDCSLTRNFIVSRYSNNGKFMISPYITSTFSNESLALIFGDIEDGFGENPEPGLRVAGFEIRTPVIFSIGRFELELNPCYNIPVNYPNENIRQFASFSADLNYTFPLD